MGKYDDDELILPTPKQCLPKGYPLPSAKESRKFAPIWKRAFELHVNRHIFNSYGTSDYGPWVKDILDPVGESKNNRYCDCYIRAWLEIMATDKNAKYITTKVKEPTEELDNQYYFDRQV